MECMLRVFSECAHSADSDSRGVRATRRVPNSIQLIYALLLLVVVGPSEL